MPNPLPDETAASIHTVLGAGRKLDAIRLYREATGVGLAEAAAFVDQHLQNRHAGWMPQRLCQPR